MNRSENINELATALTKVKFGAIKRDKTVRVTSKRTGQTYTFSYAPLETIMSAIRGPLADQGLVLSQDVVQVEGRPQVETLLMHTSGQWRSCCVPVVIDTGGAQELGSAISYARRYGITLITCTVADEDDDGNIAEGNAVTKPPLPKAINPRDGFMDSLDEAARLRVLDMAIEVKDAWAAGDLGTAFRAHAKHHKALETAEEQIALWDQYDSKLRSALTKRLDEVKAAQKAKAELGSQA